MHDLSKVHKKLVDVFPSLRPLSAAFKRPTYKLAKFLVPILSSIIINEHTVQKQPPELPYEKGVLRNFTKFTGKHLCQNLFFNKRDSGTGVFL